MNGLLFALALLSAGDGRDWGATLRMDATALHDDIAANHPGPVNPEDPQFAARNDAQLKRALERAGTAKTFADYFYAMRQYVASFDDGHVEFGVFGNTPEDYRWPGFLTRYDQDGRQRVFVSEDWSPVPVGARLLECDGKSADTLSEEILGSILGRWKLRSQRQKYGPMLFTNKTNPYVIHPARCTFDVGGTPKTVSLDWRPVEPMKLFGKIGADRDSRQRAVGMRRLADGTRWLSLPTFNGDPGSEHGKALSSVVAALSKEREALRASPAIVLDLRGNGGGSSDWSVQIARSIWGEGALAALPPNRATVMWRASAANLAALEDAYRQRMKSGALSKDVQRWFQETIGGLRGAIAAGRPVWHPPANTRPKEPPSRLPAHRLSGSVYVITDFSCMSACLDAVDLWRALGAVHLGQETSADTLYMEVREAKLPSGLGSIALPMKVYRGRARGNNEPVVPHRPYSGDINDTAALEAWVATLR
jgi:hypothetical protein